MRVNLLQYILVFPGSNSCTSFGNQWGVPTCTDPNDPVWVSLLGNTIIYHHKTQCLTVKIVKSVSESLVHQLIKVSNAMILFQGYRFDIYIWQGDCLAEKSCGVCVKWNCELERRVPNPPPVIPKICDQFVNVAQKRAVGPVNPNVLDQARTTCINDVNAQFDANVSLYASEMEYTTVNISDSILQAALVVPALVIQDAVKDLLDDDIMVTVMERNCLQKLKN